MGGRINNDGTLDGSSSAVSNSWVKGRWTVCSGLKDGDAAAYAGEIRIEGDIKYIGTYPTTGPYAGIFPITLDAEGKEKIIADGLLGLVSGSAVRVMWTNAIHDHGVTIHASIMATAADQLGGFTVDTEFTNDGPNAVNGDKNINLMGGLIQYYRGVVATFETGAGLRTGFQKNYKYDKRLYYMTPPSFPVAVNLKMKSWKE